MQSGAQPSGNVDARHTADSTSRRWPAPRPPAPGVGALAHRDAYAPAARAQSQRAPSRALLDSLHQLTRTSQTLSGRLESGAARLLGALNTPEQVTRLEGLKRAVLNSGLFLEARLAGKSNEPALDLSRDFKAALLRLRAELAPQLPATQDTRLTDIATQVERTLARLDLSQLATVAADREHRPAWALELPLRTQDDQVDVARLNIQREDDAHGNDENAQRTYSAVLKLEPAGLGRVTAHITLVLSASSRSSKRA
ncbi:MAG: hypothetical protein AAFN78_19900 [Pseudomonadota bacterium]